MSRSKLTSFMCQRNWEKEDYDPDYSEDYDYDSEITLKAVERSVDNITAKTTYIDVSLLFLWQPFYFVYMKVCCALLRKYSMP